YHHCKMSTTAKPTNFTSTIAPHTRFPPASKRYHLYIGNFCPFAHRVAITLRLKNLTPHISTSTVHWLRIPVRGGWKFLPEEGYIDHLYNSERLADLYEKACPGFGGKHSVPVLWDKVEETIVNNESADLVRILGHT